MLVPTRDHRELDLARRGPLRRARPLRTRASASVEPKLATDAARADLDTEAELVVYRPPADLTSRAYTARSRGYRSSGIEARMKNEKGSSAITAVLDVRK